MSRPRERAALPATNADGLHRPAAPTRDRVLVAFGLGTLFFAYAFVQRVSPSVMTGELMRDFAVGGAALGSLSAFYFYAYASIQLPVGMLTDRFGPRKLMSFAAALCALATLVFAHSETLLMASLGRALIGATVAFAFVGTLAIASYWFRPERFAMLAGVLQSVGMCGAIFGQAPLRQLVEALDWRGSMYLLAAAGVLLALLLFYLVPMRSPAQREVGARTSAFAGLHAIAGNPQTWICALIGFGMASSMLGFGGLWGVPWLQSVHGFTPTHAAATTSMIFVGWAIFSPFMGWISDRIGRRNPVLLAGALVALAALAILLNRPPSSPAAMMALIFVLGAGGSAMTVCFGSVRELNHPGYGSTAVGLMNMCVVGSGAVMQPLIGWLLDSKWDGALLDGARIYSAAAYDYAFHSLLIMLALALIAGFGLRETRCRPVWLDS